MLQMCYQRLHVLLSKCVLGRSGFLAFLLLLTPSSQGTLGPLGIGSTMASPYAWSSISISACYVMSYVRIYRRSQSAPIFPSLESNTGASALSSSYWHHRTGKGPVAEIIPSPADLDNANVASCRTVFSFPFTVAGLADFAYW
jgi:hypothetical protein